jgi:hypothetical protein
MDISHYCTQNKLIFKVIIRFFTWFFDFAWVNSFHEKGKQTRFYEKTSLFPPKDRFKSLFVL